MFAADRVTLSWSAPADAGSSASLLRYDTVRSTSPSTFVGSTCVASNTGPTTTSTDAAVPGPGQAWFYLVRARNGCMNGAGTLGARLPEPPVCP